MVAATAREEHNSRSCDQDCCTMDLPVIINVVTLLQLSIVKADLCMLLVRIVKDVPADSKEGKQALHSSVSSDSSNEKTSSTSV